MGGLYDDDVLEWSEHQAALLRRVAAGERLNDQVDWANVVEEIESVGREQLHAVESPLVHALLHLLKADARRRFVPSMRQRLDLVGLYRDAVAAMPDSLDGLAPLPVPPVCPVTLDELLAQP
jgi:hypothetical protein